MKITKFEEIESWREARILTKAIYSLTNRPKLVRDFGLRDQMQRASVSIMSNIAEGFERESQKEALSFLSYAKGSCGELRTQVHIGIRIGYISSAKGAEWLQEATEIASMIKGLINAKRRFLNNS